MVRRHLLSAPSGITRVFEYLVRNHMLRPSRKHIVHKHDIQNPACSMSMCPNSTLMIYYILASNKRGIEKELSDIWIEIKLWTMNEWWLEKQRVKYIMDFKFIKFQKKLKSILILTWYCWRMFWTLKVPKSTTLDCVWYVHGHEQWTNKCSQQK